MVKQSVQSSHALYWTLTCIGVTRFRKRFMKKSWSGEGEDSHRERHPSHRSLLVSLQRLFFGSLPIFQILGIREDSKEGR